MFKTLFSKLYFMMALPLAALIIVTFYYVSSLHQNYEVYNRNLEKIPLIVSSYELLSELQKERGMSAAFLSGADNFVDLEAQRNKANSKISKLEPLLQNSELSITKSLLADIESLKMNRSRIDSRSYTKNEVIQNYTRAIFKLMDLKLLFKKEAGDKKIDDYLNDLLIIEDAKEAGGKLRANIASFLSRDLPLTQSELLLMISLKGKLFVNLESKVISWNQESKAIINEFYDSKDTKFIKDTFEVFLLKNKKGKYDIDSKTFFNHISKSLSILDKLVKLKQAELSTLNSKNKSLNWNKFLSVLTVLVAFLIGVIVCTKFFIQRLIKMFRIGLHNLNNKAFAISMIFSRIDKSATQISKSSSEQTKSIQSISKTITEVEGMVKENDEYAKGASVSSKRSLVIVQEGKVVVEEVHSSIKSLEESNKELEQMINKFSVNFEQIVEVIMDISAKTSIIKDIVFQTKLLSFNASVESARAGEHGKGFSVVAEEIGSLASVSGEASEEITTLINSSNDIVKGIINDMNITTSKFIAENKGKLDNSLDNADKCINIFEKIKDNFDDISSKIDNLSDSSKKQTAGIQNISSSMSLIDTSIDGVEKISSSNAEVTKKANTNVKNLVGTIDDLCVIVRGESLEASEKSLKEA